MCYIVVEALMKTVSYSKDGSKITTKRDEVESELDSDNCFRQASVPCKLRCHHAYTVLLDSL